MPYEIRFASKLNADRQSVWNSICRMKGVNYELSPIIRMTYPADADKTNIEDAQVGQTLFVSLILMFRFIPCDLHYLRLEKVDQSRGFSENSTSLMQRSWKHERKLRSVDANRCILMDQVRFDPKIQMTGLFLEPFVRRLFEHRHRRLHKRFGGSLVEYPA